MTALLEKNFNDRKNLFCTVGLANIIVEGRVANLLEQRGYTVKIVK